MGSPTPGSSRVLARNDFRNGSYVVIVAGRVIASFGPTEKGLHESRGYADGYNHGVRNAG